MSSTIARPAASLTPRSATYFGLGAITLATLTYEIGITRIFSVTMWYHFAFVAISLALFGMTAGALIVFLWPAKFPAESVKNQLWAFSLGFAVTLPLCFALQLQLPFEPKWSPGGLASVMVTCVVIAVPFVFSGVVVCLALTRFPEQVNRLYAADLVGAALGCIGFVLLLRWFDGPSAVIAIGAIGAAAALLFARDARSSKGVAASLVVVLVVGLFAVGNSVLHDRRRAIVKIERTKGADDPKHLYEDWNNFSRITVDGDPNTPGLPAGWGMSSTLPLVDSTRQLTMTIDSSAATPLTHYTGNPEETRFLRYDITNLGHEIEKDADVLVVGVGGGRDILSALQYDQKSVTGVELNGDILKTLTGKYGDFTGHIDRDPRVKLVNDEARSYLTRTDRKYDMIQISLIDTWAATAAGAYSLSENALYTTDAFKVFFDRLTPNGVLSISRWYEIGDLPPLETYRTTALAAKSLKNEGVANPRDNVVIYHAPKSGYNVSAATILIKPHEAFTAGERAALDKRVRELQFTPVLTATEAKDDHFANLASPDGPGAEVARFDENISAPSDARPFFFQMADLDTFLSGNGFRNDLVTRPVLVLVSLGFVVMMLALLCIIFPLLLKTRRQDHVGMGTLYVFFAGIGLGFLLIELSQLQRLSIFLGHPTYALTVVLFSLLLSSGIGSMLVPRITRGERGGLVPLVGLLVVLIGYAIAQPRVIDALASSTTPVRIMGAIALLVPVGLFMGMPFSIGMRTANARRADAPTAFLWGINGATSVCASVVGMVLAVFFGIAITFWIGMAAYTMAAVALALALRSASVPEPAVVRPDPAVVAVGD